MRKCNDWPIAVCTWSLRLPAVRELAAEIKGMGIAHVHLALAPALEPEGDDYLRAVSDQGWTATCTMMAFAEEDYSSKQTIKATGGIFPDATWERNRTLVIRAMDLTAAMGVAYLSFHFGFIGKPDSAPWRKILERTRLLAGEAARRKVSLLMETGQESAEELRSFLEQLGHPAVGVNFDPANMILYDAGDPVGAVAVLAPWIRHVHIKDGRRPASATQWGVEVPWGDGHVGADAFLRALQRIGYDGALAIERESGVERAADIRLAADRLERFTG